MHRWIANGPSHPTRNRRRDQALRKNPRTAPPDRHRPQIRAPWSPGNVEEWIAANICRSTSEADAMAARCDEAEAPNSGDLESRIEETSEGKSRQHQKPDDASHPSTRKSHPLLSRPLPRSQQIRPKIECARMPLASESRRQLGRAMMTEQGRTAPVPQTTPTGKPEQIATSFKPRGNDD